MCGVLQSGLCTLVFPTMSLGVQAILTILELGKADVCYAEAVHVLKSMSPPFPVFLRLFFLADALRSLNGDYNFASMTFLFLSSTFFSYFVSLLGVECKAN